MRPIGLRPVRLALALTAALMTCTVAAASAAPKPATSRAKPVAASTVAAPSAPSPVIAALLAGVDARAAVAQARSKTSSGGAVVPSGAAADGYARALARVGDVLSAMRHRPAATSADALRATIETAQAQRLLVDANLDRIGDELKAHTASATALTRWAQHRAAAMAAMDALDTRLDALNRHLAQQKASDIGDAELDDVAQAIAQSTPALHVYGANPLPVNRPGLLARAPALTPLLVPTYADRSQDAAAVAADLAATDDAPQSEAILTQAQQLGHDYTRILDFVRGQVRTQWYAGAQKGADGTLAALAGNDVDQASLLIALLRASGAPARYVRGVVEVPVDDLRLSLGVPVMKVGQALTAAGVANAPVLVGGRIAAYRIEQVYVSARLPFSAYRGTSADRSGATWLPLLPALKPHAFIAATGVVAKAAIDVRAFVEDYLSAAQSAMPRGVLESRVRAYLSTLSPAGDFDAQLARHAVQAASLQLLPSGPPVPIVAVTGESALLADDLRQFATLRLRAGTDENAAVLLERRVPVAQLRNRRVTLSFEPASIDDGAIADSYGGMGAAPPYLIHLRPVFNLGGEPTAHGGGEVETGVDLRLELAFDGPGGSIGYSQNILSGGYTAIAIDVQGEAPVPQADAIALAGDSEPAAARLLANLGARYLAQWDGEDAPLADLLGVSPLRPFPSAVLVMNEYRVDRIGGTVDGLTWQGVAMDAGLRPAEPMAQGDTLGAESDWLLLSSLQGSVLEHRVFEEQWAVDSVSADKGFAQARADGIPVLWIAPGGSTSALTHPPEVIAAVRAWLDRGYAVEIPRDPVQVRYWHGAVWRALNNASGESGYFIAGALAGGATAMPPAVWTFADLAALLANPYSQLPNTDPNSAVALSLDASTQNQRAVAGHDLAQPLRAAVRDVNGRPVQGAPVVFNVVQGTMKLRDENGQLVTQLSVRSDRYGVAEAPAHLGDTTGALGYYIIGAGMTYPQWVGYNAVEVTAPNDHGTLQAGQPFAAGTLPDVPASIVVGGVSGDMLNPGVSYRVMSAIVNDSHGNEISNAAIDIAATTQYTPVPVHCTAEPGDSVIDARLFAPGQCPADAYLLTGNACTAPAIEVLSRPLGASFNVVPPNAGSASVHLALTSASASAAETLRTADFYVNEMCASDVVAFLGWGDIPPAGTIPLLGQSLAPIDAARPNQLLPRSQRGDIVRATIKHSSPPTVTWTPVDGAVVTFGLVGGSGENLRNSGGGTYLWDLRAGPTPRAIQGDIIALLPSGARVSLAPRPTDLVHPATDDDGFTFGWVVDPGSPLITPNPVPLTAFNATDATIRITAHFAPNDYRAVPLTLQLLDGDAVVAECPAAIGTADLFCDIPRGLRVEPLDTYTARTVLNDGTPFRMESGSTTLRFGQGLIDGLGLLTLAQGQQVDPFQIAALVGGRFPKTMSTSYTLDVATQYACTTGETFAYVLGRDAHATLKFFPLDSSGEPSPISSWTPLDNEAQVAGAQSLPITPYDLPFGEYSYTLEAQAADGTHESQSGHFSNRFERHDSLPLAHSIVKGVDVFDGNMVISETDIALPGRGPGLKLSRTYSSHQGNQRGVLGAGWVTDLDGQVRQTSCDERIVTGAAGQGMNFIPDRIEADGAQVFRPMHGFHATLVLRNGEYDLYAKDGTRYHYSQFDPLGPRLTSATDANGNRLSYQYETLDGFDRITHVRDDAGRQIDLSYALVTLTHPYGSFTAEERVQLLVAAKGPLDLLVTYEYDADGNLKKATRGDGSGGQRAQAYTYRDYGGIVTLTETGAISYQEFGFRMESAKNALDNANRTYTYQLAWSSVSTPAGVLNTPEQRVVTLTEPDTGVTHFQYDGQRGLGAVTTDVKDDNQHTTHYALDFYGAADAITDPAGTTSTLWDFVHLQPRQVTDALNTVTTYIYDDAGNKTGETIAHASGTQSRSWTYAPAANFDPPYIKDRLASATDWRGHDTGYSYDSHGNRLTTTRGGITERDDYAANGDHSAHTDGAGKVWTFRYDASGLPSEAEDPLHHVQRSVYDLRGRKRSETDANGKVTGITYDAQDRPLVVTYPITDAGSEISTFVYDDAADRKTETIHGVTTLSQSDAMGRVTSITTPAGTRSLHYDKVGNKLDESDFAGNITRFVYDDANRLTYKREPEGRTTHLDYDPVGHVTRETVGQGDNAGTDARITEYLYAHPLYKRTDVRRALTSQGSSSWVVDHVDYDPNGNAVLKRDALDRVTTLAYDDRDRPTSQSELLGRLTTWTYDGADRKLSETRANASGSGDQVRRWTYDDAGRAITTVDAVGAQRTTTYDNVGNVTQKRDSRSGTVASTYDARNRLLTQSGPEAGQITRYSYDINGNRSGETWANGRAIVYTYDTLNRRVDSSDGEGRFEHLTYLPDGEVATRTDANSHLTTSHYDDLHRLTGQSLPAVGGVTRETSRHYNVHGDVIDETDPESHVTAYAYDSLGRRTSTTLPIVDGQDATLYVGYDDVGNIRSQKDARGNLTTFDVDDLNRRTKQTDPPDGDGNVYTQAWTYDAIGNVLAHTDRRGIVTLTSYDKENRVGGSMRDFLLLETNVRDSEGNITSSSDALHRTTQFVYDRANRKTGESRPLGATLAWTYAPLGDVLTSTDADGRVSTNTYTSRRFLESETNNAAETTLYHYDGEGHRTSMQRPGGDDFTWLYAYDEGDRLIRVTDPDNRATVFGHDRDGNRTQITDAKNHITTFAYDARHHLRSRTYPHVTAGTGVHAWTYDADGNPLTDSTPNGVTLTTDYDALNRLTHATYGAALAGQVSATAWTHDPNGNLVGIRETLDGAARNETRRYDRFDRLEHVTDVLGHQVDYTYDDVGNRLSLKDSDGQTSTWTYDALNRNTSLGVPAQGTTTMAYFPSGKLLSITRPDGSSSANTYDDAGRIESLEHAKAGATIARYAYTYDLNGNRHQQKETNGGAEEVTTYRYDHADRLTQIAEPDRTSDYVLDDVGNRSDEQITDGNGVVISHSVLAYDARDALTTRNDSVQNIHATLSYDLDGNQTGQVIDGAARSFVFDARDRMVSLSQPNAPPLVFDYDSEGQRLRKTQGPAETRYQYDGHSLLAESNAIGNTLARYHFGATQLLSRTEAGSTPVQRHYLLDALHSPIGLLTQDGAISARTSYDAWGEVRHQQGTGGATVTPNRDGAIADLASTDQQPIGFTGYVKDSESGLYYAKARYYDPVIARFTSEDPEAGKDLQPPSLHRYLYAYANPTVYTDPSGRCIWDGCIVEGALLAGVITWAGSVIQDEWSNDKEFGQAAANPRNIGNGFAVTGVVLSGGTIGISATAGIVAAGGAIDLAHQTAVEGKSLDEADYAQSLRTGGISALGGPIVGRGLASATPWIAGGSHVLVGGAVAYGAYQGGGDIGEGIANDNTSQVLLGVGETSLSFSGAGTLAKTRLNTQRTSELTPAGLDARLDAYSPTIGAPEPVTVSEAPNGNGVMVQPAQRIGKYANRLDVEYRTSEEVNAEYPVGFKPPYQSGTRVTEYTTKSEDRYVRVHGETNRARSWLMRPEAIEGLNSKEIARKYSLPAIPKYMSDVAVPSGTRMRTGKTAQNFDGGHGATQYELLQRIPEDAFTNTKPISDGQ